MLLSHYDDPMTRFDKGRPDSTWALLPCRKPLRQNSGLSYIEIFLE